MPVKYAKKKKKAYWKIPPPHPPPPPAPALNCAYCDWRAYSIFCKVLYPFHRPFHLQYRIHFDTPSSVLLSQQLISSMLFWTDYSETKKNLSPPKTSTPRLGPTQLPIQTVPRYSTGEEGGRGVKLTTHLHLLPMLRTSGAIPLFPLLALWCGQEQFYCVSKYACGTYEGRERCAQGFGGETCVKETTGETKM